MSSRRCGGDTAVNHCLADLRPGLLCFVLGDELPGLCVQHNRHGARLEPAAHRPAGKAVFGASHPGETQHRLVAAGEAVLLRKPDGLIAVDELTDGVGESLDEG